MSIDPRRRTVEDGRAGPSNWEPGTPYRRCPWKDPDDESVTCLLGDGHSPLAPAPHHLPSVGKGAKTRIATVLNDGRVLNALGEQIDTLDAVRARSEASGAALRERLAAMEPEGDSAPAPAEQQEEARPLVDRSDVRRDE
jgi:hypothetical protein